MKKLFLMYFLLVLGSFFVYAQNEASEDLPSDLDFSFLDTKFLINVPNSWSKYDYQNRAGDFFTNKQVKAMVLGLPENEKLMKQYNGFLAATYAFAGLFVASYAVQIAYNFNDNLPNRQTVSNITSYVSLMTFCGGLLTGNAADARMRRAVDNYNYAIIMENK